MRATRRYWGVGAVAGFLVALAVLFERPVLLFGAATVAAWLVTRQYAFYRGLRRSVTAMDVGQSISPERVTIDESVSLTISATLPSSSDLQYSVRPSLPVAAVAEPPDAGTLHLSPGQRESAATVSVSWPVAGAYELPPPTVVATDSLGLLREELSLGPRSSVTVEPRGPRNVHIGTGSGEIATAYGEHPAGRLGSGLDPAELREYAPGDPSDRIDWKATARLGKPFVRKFEAETDRRTALLFDHRSSVGTGPPGETKLDYLREAALAFVESARRLDDPIGCYTVGDAGITNQHAPEATYDQFVRLRSVLYELRATDGDADDGGLPGGEFRPAESARAAASALDGDDSPFGRTLRPFFDDATTYIRRVHGDPLFETAHTSLVRLRGRLWTAIFTDDERRGELRETVKIARRGDDHVFVFLAPSVLFERGELADLETAYDRYVDFEEFRRELARMPRVHAFEVGPGDRIDAVLAAGRKRRERRAVAGGV